MGHAAAPDLREALLRQIAAARVGLAARLPGDGRVHAARKAIKQARALLRLARGAMPEADYRTDNIALRDAGRRLSPLRDARSLLDAFRAFAGRQAASLRGTDLAALEDALRTALAGARRDLQSRATRRDAAGLLERVAHLPVDSGAPALADAFRTIYRDGRRQLRRAREAPSARALHEWRKQVQYLLHAAEFLRSRGTGKLRKLVDRAGRVAGWLGDDHDLWRLSEALGQVSLDPAAVGLLRDLIARRRERLRKRAFAAGDRLYAQKPERVAARVRAGAGRRQDA